MSSHHIVREKQEPALLVLGMDGFPDELLGQLLEWSPTVLVTQLMAEKLNASGIKIDWIITDNVNDDIQSDVKLLSITDGQFIKTALKFLIENDFPAVNIVTDVFQLHDYTPFSDEINLVIFYKTQKIYPIRSGFNKWTPGGEIIELLTQPANLHLAGLEAITASCYKTINDGVFTLAFDDPFLFIAETL